MTAPRRGGDGDGKKSPRSPRRLFLAAVIVVLSALIGVFAVEGILWIVAPVRYHEWLLWVPDGHIQGRAVPGQVLHTAEGCEIRINRLGFRGPDPDWEPPAGTLRIVAFGGSSTFCYHACGEEKTWTGALQRLLQERLGLPVEVVNLALPGFGTATSKVNYLFLGRDLHPHVALLYHTWNDMKLFRNLARAPQPFARVASDKPLWQRVARATQIGRRARNTLLNLKLARIENYYTSLEREGAGAARPVAPGSLAWARRNFADFVGSVRRDGVLPVLISQATIVRPENFENREYRLQFGSDLVGMTAPVIHETWLEMNELLREAALGEGAIYVNGYEAVPGDMEHLTDHVHLTETGSAVLAEAIADTLLEDPRFLEVANRVRDGVASRAGAKRSGDVGGAGPE